ncbi:MAG: LemA family protein, partial [Hyphomicrobiaceae bacterium]|nr:LemA family protein [Hyphomicrobiaceae bacterium]
YNGAARNLNVLVESFPSNLIAGAFAFAPREFFQIGEDDRATPAVTFGG